MLQLADKKSSVFYREEGILPDEADHDVVGEGDACASAFVLCQVFRLHGAVLMDRGHSFFDWSIELERGNHIS